MPQLLSCDSHVDHLAAHHLGFIHELEGLYASIKFR